MVDIRKNTYKRNGIETTADNNKTLWLNEEHIEEGLDLKNLREITTKYNSNHRKRRYQLAEETKKQVNIIFIDEKLAINVIMVCRTTMAHKCKTRL